MNSIIKAAAFAVCLLAPAGAFAQSKEGEYEFTGSEFKWNKGGSTIIYYGVVNKDGKVSVCGKNYVKAGGRAKSASGQLIEEARVQLNGRSIMKDLSFFTYTNSDAEFKAAKVSCQDTDMDYPAKTRLKLRVDQSRFSD